LFFIQLYRWFPSVLKAITIVRPETLVRWHRAGFRLYWHWKSRSLGGRPKIAADLRALIRQMSAENPLWGAPRIHGELLKLGFEVAQSSVAKYMVKRCGPPSQGWRTFLRNHAPDIAAMDLFVVPRLVTGITSRGHCWKGRRQPKPRANEFRPLPLNPLSSVASATGLPTPLPFFRPFHMPPPTQQRKSA
jgi:hypothetical protein